MAHSSKKQIAGFLLTGAAVGAAIALLYAPKSGAQTRRDIRKLSKKTVDQIDDLQNGLRKQIAEGYEQVMEAYLTGLERRAAQGQPLSPLVSVASFFVSRVDTKLDKAIEEAAARLPAGQARRTENVRQTRHDAEDHRDQEGHRSGQPQRVRRD